MGEGAVGVGRFPCHQQVGKQHAGTDVCGLVGHQGLQQLDRFLPAIQLHQGAGQLHPGFGPARVDRQGPLQWRQRQVMASLAHADLAQA